MLRLKWKKRRCEQFEGGKTRRLIEDSADGERQDVPKEVETTRLIPVGAVRQPQTYRRSRKQSASMKVVCE